MAAAISSLPSPLKSAATSDKGFNPADTAAGAPKVPSPLPRRMAMPPESVPGLPMLLIAKSGFPSPLKSAAMISLASWLVMANPIGYSLEERTEPLAASSSTRMPLPNTMAASGLPSPLKSARTIVWEPWPDGMKVEAAFASSELIKG